MCMERHVGSDVQMSRRMQDGRWTGENGRKTSTKPDEQECEVWYDWQRQGVERRDTQGWKVYARSERARKN